jgi:uncharacterized RDD family membrane protein YckC
MSQAYVTGVRAGHALDGVRTRRLLALCFDFFAISLLALVIYVALLLVTLGLSFFFLPPLWPIVAFFYSGLSMAGPRSATPGMRAADLEVRMADSGGPVPFVNAAAHGVLFYLSWCLPLVFLVTLVDADKRFLHDILTGVLVTRRR